MTADPSSSLPALPPASAAQGGAGHDEAGRLQREIDGIRMRRLGMTYDQIAQAMGYADRSGARNMITEALRRRQAENVVELRILENDRLDADEQVLRAIIHGGGDAAQRIRAIDARTRLSARRSRMNGLDAPVQVEVTTGATAEVEDALALFAEVVQLVEGRVVARDGQPVDDGSDDQLGPEGAAGPAALGGGSSGD